jgi:hypothetical protein
MSCTRLELRRSVIHADCRVYFLDPDGQRVYTQSIEAPNDKEVVKEARQRLDRYDVELWDGERLVGRFDHDRP